MSGRYLLDTNIVIALFAADEAVTTAISEADEIFIASVVLGELYYGAERSGQVEANKQRIDEFGEENVILSCDGETAKRYGQVKDKLGQKGRPIPENGVWIAALGLQHGLTIVSRDRHFEEVDDLNCCSMVISMMHYQTYTNDIACRPASWLPS